MRALIVTTVIASSTLAAADPEIRRTVAVGAGEEQIGEDAQATVGATGLASYRDVDGDGFGSAEAKTGAELRSGRTGTELGASAAGRIDLGYRELGDLPLGGLWASADVGTRPGLDARRDVARAAYAGADAGFVLRPLLHTAPGTYRGALGFALGGGLEVQGAAERAIYTFDFDGYFSCHTRAAGPASCLHVLDTYATGVSGGSGAVVSTIYLARWTGLDLGAAWGDVAFGVITDTGTLSIKNNDTGTMATVMTEDLPKIERGAWDAGLATMVGPIELHARTRRSGYLTLDGDLSLEDRVSASAVLPAGRARLSATGFAARTTWWTSKTDPGSHAATGGGELAVDVTIHRFDVHAGAGLARSFYPVLDGSAADHPALGFRSAIHVGRAIDL